MLDQEISNIKNSAFHNYPTVTGDNMFADFFPAQYLVLLTHQLIYTNQGHASQNSSPINTPQDHKNLQFQEDNKKDILLVENDGCELFTSDLIYYCLFKFIYLDIKVTGFLMLLFLLAKTGQQRDKNKRTQNAGAPQSIGQNYWQPTEGASKSLFRMEDKNSNVNSVSLPVKYPYYPRINHQTLLLSGEALIFGGSGSSLEPIRSILRFNFENSRIDQLFEAECPSIQGFSLFSSTSKVYLWGGFLENKPSNCLYLFNGKKIEQVNQKGSIPPARGFHCSAWVADRYLLIYGGFCQTQIFSDWYILDTETYTWSKVKQNTVLPKSTSFQLGWKNGRGFLVSSELSKKKGSKKVIEVKNEIFEVRITNFINFQLRIDPLHVSDGEIPPPRANPTLIFTEKKIFMLGGQTFYTKTKDVFSDFWSFDIETLTWKMILKNSLGKYGATPIIFEDKIYLFGGLRSSNEISTSIDIISFQKKRTIETHVCSLCRGIYGLDEKNKNGAEQTAPRLQISVKENWDPVTTISTSFLSKIAQYLQNPLQAFGLFIDNSLNMSASNINISIEGNLDQQHYLTEKTPYLFIGDNSRPFSSEELVKMMFSFRYRVEKSSADEAYQQQLKIRSEYGLSLKMASLRLGKSCLFVSKMVDGSIFVSYFSESGNKCPDGQSSFNCIYYTLSQKGTASNLINQQIICENVGHILKQPEFTNMEKFNAKIYIEGIYDLGKTEEDIIFCPSGIQVNFVSLSDYISKLYLNPVPGREIRVQGKKVNCFDVGIRFRQDRINGDIQQAKRVTDKILFKKDNLYEIESENYSSSLVYIYHQNRLITAISTQEKTICGFIEIPDLIGVDFFKSKIEKYEDEKKLQFYIQEKQRGKKRVREIDQYSSYGKVRKIRPTCLDL